MAKVSRTELANVIAGLLDDKTPSKQLASQIAAYLVSEHKIKDLDAIMRDVMTARAKAGIIEARLTTAFPLSSAVKTEVNQLLKQQYPTAQAFVLQETVEPQVLSGIRIQTPDKQLDETARGKIDQLIRASN